MIIRVATAPELVSETLRRMADMVKPGVTTIEINDMAEKFVLKNGGKLYNKGYHPSWAKTPYPAATCISVNDEIVHGIPRNRIIREGDVVNLDLGVIAVDGMCGDASLTVGAGKLSDEDQELLRVAEEALHYGISLISDGFPIRKFAKKMQQFVGRQGGFNVISTFSGHGIGKNMHQEPMVYNCIDSGYGKITGKFKEGKTYCIEPIITAGLDRYGEFTDDNWTVVTKDGAKTAYFEHMVKVTKTGVEVLTDHIRKA